MRTSYYGRMGSKDYKQFADKGVCISRTSRYFNGPSYPALFPTWEMINCGDEKKYEKMYREQVLSKLDPMDVWLDLGEDAILLCYESIAKIESGETFCHRHMVARWLEEGLREQYGIEVEIPELGPEDLKAVDYKGMAKSMAKKSKKSGKKVSDEVEGQMSIDDLMKEWDV